MSGILDSIERSIQAYRLKSNVDYRDIIETIKYIDKNRMKDPRSAILDIGSPAQYLYLSETGSEQYKNSKIVWLKFGWARKSGLPEMVNTQTGRTEILRLSGEVYLFEPSHFLLFEHDSNMLLLYEYNQFAPRPTRLCQYIEEYYKKMKNIRDTDGQPKIYAQKIFTRDIERLLRGYSIVKSIRIELEASAAGRLMRTLGESRSVLESLFNRFGSRIVSISWKSQRRGELEISIDDILRMFHELEESTYSFVVTVKKGWFDRSEKIDLKKHTLTFRKRIKLARNNGQILRSTDTKDAVNVLKNTIDEVVRQL